MSYEPHTWTSGETITAAKLNALEQGVAGGGGSEAVHYSAIYDEDTYEFQIEDAVEAIGDLQNGKMVIIDVEYASDPGVIASSNLIISWDQAHGSWFLFYEDQYGSPYKYYI